MRPGLGAAEQTDCAGDPEHLRVAAMMDDPRVRLRA